MTVQSNAQHISQLVIHTKCLHFYSVQHIHSQPEHEVFETKYVLQNTPVINLSYLILTVLTRIHYSHSYFLGLFHLKKG